MRVFPLSIPDRNYEGCNDRKLTEKLDLVQKRTLFVIRGRCPSQILINPILLLVIVSRYRSRTVLKSKGSSSRTKGIIRRNALSAVIYLPFFEYTRFLPLSHDSVLFVVFRVGSVQL